MNLPPLEQLKQEVKTLETDLLQAIKQNDEDNFRTKFTNILRETINYVGKYLRDHHGTIDHHRLEQLEYLDQELSQHENVYMMTGYTDHCEYIKALKSLLTLAKLDITVSENQNLLYLRNN